eukprot:1160606-Pelagomonas_calceolata.AAC.1
MQLQAQTQMKSAACVKGWRTLNCVLAIKNLKTNAGAKDKLLSAPWTLDRGAGYYWEERVRSKKPCLVETGR